MPNYNTQGITSSAGGDPRNLGGSEGYGNPSATSSSGLMSSTSNATAKDDDKDEPGFFESIANLFSGAGADLPSDRKDDDGDSGASFYDGPMFAPYDGGSDDSAAASTGLPFSTTAADRALYEALGVDVPEVYTGKMGEEEPEPNLDMDVLQDALQPEPITVEEIEVKAGDTLTAIAEEKGLPVQDVIDANPQIKNPDLIRPGEKVTLPGMLSTAGKLLKTATDPEAPAPVSEDPDREFYQSGIPLGDRFPSLMSKGVEALEGPEAVSSAAVQNLLAQTNTFSKGDKGLDVYNTQLRLAELGYDIGRGGKAGLRKDATGKWSSLDNSQMRGVDSDYGPSTEKAVKAFQKDAGLPITGSVDPETAKAMANAKPVEYFVPTEVTKNYSDTQKTNFTAAEKAAKEAGLEGAELAAFMAQVAHESDSFRTAKEYASGKAYEGRKDLGNVQAGDGKKYKGRGYIQLTGRDNYKKAGDALGLDLVNNPSLAEKPENAAAISVWFWKTKVQPQVPDFMDVERVTKVVNGGFNGLDERLKYFDEFTKNWSEN